MSGNVFVVMHEYEMAKDNFSVKMIGVYSNRDAAQAAVDRLRTQPGFQETQDRFAIDKYQLDKDHWAEGFVFAGSYNADAEE